MVEEADEVEEVEQFRGPAPAFGQASSVGDVGGREGVDERLGDLPPEQLPEVDQRGPGPRELEIEHEDVAHLGPPLEIRRLEVAVDEHGLGARDGERRSRRVPHARATPTARGPRAPPRVTCKRAVGPHAQRVEGARVGRDGTQRGVGGGGREESPRREAERVQARGDAAGGSAGLRGRRQLFVGHVLEEEDARPDVDVDHPRHAHHAGEPRVDGSLLRDVVVVGEREPGDDVPDPQHEGAQSAHEDHVGLCGKGRPPREPTSDLRGIEGLRGARPFPRRLGVPEARDVGVHPSTVPDVRGRSSRGPDVPPRSLTGPAGRGPRVSVPRSRRGRPRSGRSGRSP